MEGRLAKSEEALLRILLGHSVMPRSSQVIKYGCIAANAAIFLAWQFALRNPPLDQQFWVWLDRKFRRGFYLRVRSWLEQNFICRPGDDHVRPWTLFTSAFSHIDLGHITTNLIGFSTFFQPLALVLSPISMVGLIASTSVAGNIGFLVKERQRKFPNRHKGGLGFSGVVMGMGAAATILFPRSWTKVYGVSMPLWAATAAFFAWDMLFLTSATSQTGHAAHIGGAVVGAVYVLSLKHFNLLRSPRLWF